MSYSMLEKIKIRLKQFHTEEVENEDGSKETLIVFDKTDENPIILELIDKANADIRTTRHYPSSYSDEKIEEDMKQFSNIAIDLVLYDLRKDGVEYQTSYNVGGVSASFVNRNEILANVTPLVWVY